MQSAASGAAVRASLAEGKGWPRREGNPPAMLKWVQAAGGTAGNAPTEGAAVNSVQRIPGAGWYIRRERRRESWLPTTGLADMHPDDHAELCRLRVEDERVRYAFWVARRLRMKVERETWRHGLESALDMAADATWMAWLLPRYHVAEALEAGVVERFNALVCEWIERWESGTAVRRRVL